MGHYVYIDNLGCFSDSIDKVTGIIGRAQQRFSECGLGLHEVDVQEYGGNALGMTMDGKKLLTRNTWKRYIHIHAALTAVLHMRVVSGAALEIIVGHCTYFGLVNRDLLCIFAAVYRFISSNYFCSAALWKEAQNEIRCFRGLMMFGFSQWNLPWSSRVFAVDSSLTGFGIASSDWPLQDVKDVGRVGERGRFRFWGVGARSHSFQVAGFAVNADGKITMDDGSQCPWRPRSWIRPCH